MNRQQLLSISLAALISILLTGPAFAQNADDQTEATTFDKIQEELTRQNISLNLKQTPFREVINLFRQKVFFNIVLSREAEQMLGEGARNAKPTDRREDGMLSSDDMDQPWEMSKSKGDSIRTNDDGTKPRKQQPSVNPSVTITLNDMQLGQALKTILDQKRMTAVFANGVVKIVPKTYKRSFDTRFYDVRDLLLDIKDFRGPLLKLQNGDSSESKGFGAKFHKNENMFDFERDKEKQKPLSNRDNLTKLVRNNVGNGGWERGGRIRIHGGVMVVHQAPDIHREITHLLKRLRQFR